ncbi:hypothetical protein [Aeoliella mucimassa]|nr:hypothetical protein [Aeoliella mucimassa]
MSCDQCGCCRIVIREYRWWKFASERTEAVETYRTSDEHVHDWWLYGSSYVSWNKQWAGSNASRIATVGSFGNLDGTTALLRW